MRSVAADSLSPLKLQLRDYVVELQDTLTRVESVRSLIIRAEASGMSSVVLSGGRQLGKTCRAGSMMAATTTGRVSAMKTDDPRGERALASLRAGLSTLADNLRLCQQDDSLAMAMRTLDPRRIEQIATAATDAITQYTQIRDGLLTLLGIDLLLKRHSTPRTY